MLSSFDRRIISHRLKAKKGLPKESL
ncbi:hypothetical protein PP427_gp051 [Salmonella phage KM16]|nr:hypothetical protein PP427_gp051 [Salmonella phage KM16]